MAAQTGPAAIGARVAPPARIPRRPAVPAEGSFDQLRAEGIRLVQDLAGSTWTDYNLHDPGVTILEQLCYALTDILYRIEFPVEDHLAMPGGRIDFSTQALHGPAEALPARPATIADYRRAVLGSIGSIDNVWIETVPDALSGARGLYAVSVQCADDGSGRPVDADAVRGQVAALFRRNRNLCEDLASVTLVTPVDCELRAELEIGGARDPADVLAEVFHRCAQLVARGVVYRTFERVLEEGMPLEDILNPLHTRHGVLTDADLARADRREVFVGDLVTAVRGIDGVRTVRYLALGRSGEPPTTGTLHPRGDEREVLRLRVPADDVFADHVTVLRAGSVLAVRPHEIRQKYRDLRASEAVRAHVRQDIAARVPPPRGVHRELDTYSSIQNDFPAIYGINAHGLPGSATPERKAQARQLKAYLLLFEQFLANAAAQIHHLRSLFSGAPDVPQSYWWRVLDDEVVPGIEAIYAGIRAPAELSGRVLAALDDVPDRRGRALDHLLALYGETHAQNSLRHWMCYHDATDIDRALLDNKLAYLANVIRLGRDRGSAFDHGREAWDPRPGESPNVSGFQLRVALLLGFSAHHSRSLTAPIREAGLGVDPWDTGAGVSTWARETLDEAAVARGDFEAMAPRREAGPVTHAALTGAHGLQLGPGRRVSEVLLRHGVDLANYRVGRPAGGGDHRLLFRAPGTGRWWVLGRAATAEPLREAVQRLRRFLVDLDVACEGMHLVEHLLLRPRTPGTAERLRAILPASFFTLRMTVVFPAWTARCHDTAFRRFAEETVQINCPAHIHPECLWLGYDDLCEFEKRHRNWLRACRAATAPHVPGARASTRGEAALVELDAASLAVAAFLRDRGIAADPEAPDHV